MDLKDECLYCQQAELWDSLKTPPESENDYDICPDTHAAVSDDDRRKIAEELYTPLHPWQFRLLKLQPAPYLTEPLECQLFVANMIEESHYLKGVGLQSTGELVTYAAISYAWGKPVFSAKIRCNGIELPVTQTAYEALIYLRYTQGPRYVWIDAVCINQLDTEEKNEQVQVLMFRIFQRSIQIIGFIGQHPKYKRILRFLEYTSTRWHSTKFHTNDFRSHALSNSCKSLNHELLQQAVSFDACSIVQSAPYFRRNWIRQEFFAAGTKYKMFLQSGRYFFGLAAFCDIFDALDGATQIDSSIKNAAAIRCSRTLVDSLDEKNPRTLDMFRVWEYLLLETANYSKAPWTSIVYTLCTT